MVRLHHVEHIIVCSQLGNRVGLPALAAAVSNAGGLGRFHLCAFLCIMPHRQTLCQVS